ncbi:MAG: tRNA 2-thiocytidine biosynthesis protein TtcA [Clostridia bacterium]|nr:tRNA 2-thiocytidine biosynthesis protein TtcA [Clostridia bacterium]
MTEQTELLYRAEHSITKKYRAELWTPFIAAIKRYELISPGDRIAVCISGGKDSMLLAKMMQMLARYTEIPFEAVNLTMDPGYSEANRKKIEENAALLELPLHIFETNVFSVANRQEKNPCYLCAKMRRGHLYARAKELGCNKIALGHHFNDVIETTVLAMLYGSQLQAMIPKVKSLNFEGMELIRPLYCVHEDDIIAWGRYCGLEFLRCACRFTEMNTDEHENASKRKEVKALIRRLKETNPDVEKSIFNSIHAVNIDTFPGYKTDGATHSFLENYDKK